MAESDLPENQLLERFVTTVKAGGVPTTEELEAAAKYVGDKLQNRPTKNKRGPKPIKLWKRINIFANVHRRRAGGENLEDALQDIAAEATEYDRLVDWYSKGRYTEEKRIGRMYGDFALTIDQYKDEGLFDWAEANLSPEEQESLTVQEVVSRFRDSQHPPKLKK